MENRLVDIVASTKTGSAKYKPGTNIEAVGRGVLATGAPVATGGRNTSWKVAELPDAIGASEEKNKLCSC